MKWIDNLWWQREWYEKREIMIQDLPEWLKHDFNIWSAYEKYLIRSKKEELSEVVKWCNIYHIRIQSDYDYEGESNDINNLEEEMQLKLKQEWIKRYQEENKTIQPSRKKRIERKIEKKHLQEVESIRENRKIHWREDEREFELVNEIEKEQEERELKIKEKYIDLAYKDVEKFKEYTSIYNLLKFEINIKKWHTRHRDLNNIDMIIIENNKNKNIINQILPTKLKEKMIIRNIKTNIKSILRQWYLIDDKTYNEIINNYTKEIYGIFNITNPTERKAKIEELSNTNPSVVKVRNSLNKTSTVYTEYSRPSSWWFRYDDTLKWLKENNIVYEVKY